MPLIGIEGFTTITKTINETGEIAWEQRKQNTVNSTARDELVDALRNDAYDWNNSSMNGGLAWHTGYTGTVVPSGDFSGGGTGIENWATVAPYYKTVIVGREETTDHGCLFKQTSAPAVKGGGGAGPRTITMAAQYDGSVLGSTHTFDSAEIGNATAWLATGAGALDYDYAGSKGFPWATNTFTAVTITSTDTLTITWELVIG